jgi:DNA-binding NarL/FixJ family response regulator
MTPVRVLLVDDARNVRVELRTALSLSGEVEIVGEAANGLEAVEAANRLKPDVIVMDLEMPVMNGFEAARLLKEQGSPCRVVALTIHDEPTARRRAAEAGIDIFLVKGGSLDDMLQAIGRSAPSATGGLP